MTTTDPHPSATDAATDGDTPQRDVVPFRQAVRAWFGISLHT